MSELKFEYGTHLSFRRPGMQGYEGEFVILATVVQRPGSQLLTGVAVGRRVAPVAPVRAEKSGRSPGRA